MIDAIIHEPSRELSISSRQDVIHYDKRLQEFFEKRGYKLQVDHEMEYSYISKEQKLKFTFLYDTVMICTYYEEEPDRTSAYWGVNYKFTNPKSFESFVNIVNSYLTNY